MALFWKIFFAIGAIWFVILCMRPHELNPNDPRIKKQQEKIQKYYQKHKNSFNRNSLGLLGTIIFWVCLILFFTGLIFIIQKLP